MVWRFQKQECQRFFKRYCCHLRYSDIKRPPEVLCARKIIRDLEVEDVVVLVEEELHLVKDRSAILSIVLSLTR